MHLRHASEKNKKIATIITFFTIPLSGFMTDIYLPSFPSMAQNLSVSEKNIQLTLTCFFLSYGFAQLFVGSILDSLGRYKPVLFSLIALVISSLAITWTDQVGLICFWRIVQGLGTSFIVVAKRAYFVDVYDEEKRKHFLSYFTIVWSCGPIIAPFLGGYLESLFNWQANFYFLAIYAGILFFAELFFSGETIRNLKRFNLKKTSMLYAVMLKNKAFVLGILILGLAYSTVMVFNIAGPFVVEHHFGFNAVTTGYCTLILGISWMIGGILSKTFSNYNFPKKLRISTFIQVVLLILFVIVAMQLDQLYLLVGFAFIIHIVSGFIFTNYFTQNMIYFPSNAGIAGGLIGGLLYIITSISSFLISSSGNIATTFDMSLRYLGVGIPLVLVIFYSSFLILKKQQKKTKITTV
ncbi:MAG: MFS transporter [Zunongwangia sp.]|nr:MFS transporter [Zunongwangia profunda]MAO34959.1 MFS transporter [Zunongwangia sp.]MAS71769.1 MFS transporter [Zunongwangia sp.]|tara:strand:+ start:2153 stop:3379 length:1227 start_codon:yes stop_codon:yes gene_type:complete